MTPAAVALFSMAAPEAWSRLTMTSDFTPSPIICCAIDFMVAGLPFAFWMSQLSLYCVHAAFSAVGSAVTQRGEDVVSGRMIPTFAPLPSTVPLLVELLVLVPPAGDETAFVLAGGAEE